MTEERRIHNRLHKYWEEVRGAKSYPLESDIDPDVLADIWDDCFLINLHSGEDRQADFSYLGKNLIEAYGDDVTGKGVCDILIDPHGSSTVERIEKVLESQAPVEEEGEFTNASHLRVQYREILLPLGENGAITYIIGGMRWRSL